MERNYLRFKAGDANNAVLAAVGYNFRRLIRWLRPCCDKSSSHSSPNRSSIRAESRILHGRLPRQNKLTGGLHDTSQTTERYFVVPKRCALNWKQRKVSSSTDRCNHSCDPARHQARSDFLRSNHTETLQVGSGDGNRWRVVFGGYRSCALARRTISCGVTR